MKYLQYTSEDLAVEESFINYVKGSNTEDVNFWKDWILANPSHSEVVAHAKDIVNSLKFRPSTLTQEKQDQLWNAIRKTTTENNSEPTKKGVIRLMPWLMGAAASLAVLLLFTIGGQSEISFTSDFAEFNELTLPEGSTVELNAQTELNYNKKSFEKNRIVSLDGEAFFSVKKGSSFKVETENGTVEVLGTEFNVYSRDDVFKVSCISGRVSVKSRDEVKILTAEDNVYFKNGVKFNENVEIDHKRNSWRRGVYHFDDVALGEILKDVERHFGVQVSMASQISQLRYSGSFTCKDIDTALSEVCWPLNLKFEKEGNTIKIFE